MISTILMRLLDFFPNRFKIFGNYVVMFTEVSKSVIRVLVVFSVFLLAFGIVFYVLLKDMVRLVSLLSQCGVSLI